MSTARNHSARRFWFAAFLLFAVWILVQFTGCAPSTTIDSPCETYYRMPSKALCRWGGYGNPKVYYGCTDGRTYINPTYYSEESVCK